jgi:hypothetical protein
VGGIHDHQLPFLDNFNWQRTIEESIFTNATSATFGAAIALITTAFLGNIIGARLVAGDDNSACHTLIMVFLRAAAPLLLLLLVVLYTKPSFLLSVCLTSISIVLMIIFKVVTLKDINTLGVAISGLAGRGSARLPIASKL